MQTCESGYSAVDDVSDIGIVQRDGVVCGFAGRATEAEAAVVANVKG
jgi:hypothetical protein